MNDHDETVTRVLKFLDERTSTNSWLNPEYREAAQLIREAHTDDSYLLDCRDVACDLCGAAAGAPCTDDLGNRCQPHDDRQGELWRRRRRELDELMMEDLSDE